MDFAAGVYLSESPSPPRFLWSRNFVGSQSGQIQSMQNMVSNRTPPPPPPPLYTVYIYTVYLFTQGRGDES